MEKGKIGDKPSVECQARLFHALLCQARPYKSMNNYVMPCQAIICHTIICWARLCHAMQCHVMPCHVRPGHAMPCKTMLCHAMPGYNMPHHDMLGQAMPWFTMVYYVIQCFLLRGGWGNALLKSPLPLIVETVLTCRNSFNIIELNS